MFFAPNMLNPMPPFPINDFIRKGMQPQSRSNSDYQPTTNLPSQFLKDIQNPTPIVLNPADDIAKLKDNQFKSHFNEQMASIN